MIDKRITLDTLLVGDKNALVIAARASGYGNEYETKVPCPSCGSTVEYSFDLDEVEVKEIFSDDDLGISFTGANTFSMIVAINGDADSATINKFVDSMPAFDSRHLRGAYTKIVPDIDMQQEFTCSDCGHEQIMEVPLTADFFWPR